jgi:hypothetical protein
MQVHCGGLIRLFCIISINFQCLRLLLKAVEIRFAHLRLLLVTINYHNYYYLAIQMLTLQLPLLAAH